MKKILSILAVMALGQTVVFSQGCLPQGIAFTTQAQIDSFQINYPGCTQIEGDVVIQGFDISNLNGLNVLTSIGGGLHISGSMPSLPDLSGLNALTSIGGNFMINDLTIPDLSGLDALTTVAGDFLIIYMMGLESLTGLDALVSVGGDFEIATSNNLTSIAALSSLTTIGGVLGFGPLGSLTNLTGLEALTSIGGDASFTAIGVENLTGLNSLTSIGGALVIQSSHGISSLSGLDQLEGSSIESLVIIQNDVLTDCAIQPVCEYLAIPGGTVEIHDNSTGCNSQEEVQTACDTLGVNELPVQHSEFSVMCSPNPFQSLTSLTYELPKATMVRLTLFNSQGGEVEVLVNEVQSKGVHQVSWKAGNLPTGIYFYRIQAGNEEGSGKIVKW